MPLRGVHLLLTYRCLYECDHCFVWGSPRQQGVMTLSQLAAVTEQAGRLGTVEWIYFEGGEPFLYHPVLVRAARQAHDRGLRIGVVSNGYWATALDDAVEWLQPLAGVVDELEISSDAYHSGELEDPRPDNARRAAERLGMPVALLAIAAPEDGEAVPTTGTLPTGTSAVKYRGRAAQELADRVRWLPWDSFSECPCEDLRDTERVHVDPLGNVHVCQGIVIGNLFVRPLPELWAGYEPARHPIVGPLIEGGPAELVRRYRVEVGGSAADACHLCYRAREQLRPRFPEILAPDQMYGVEEDV